MSKLRTFYVNYTMAGANISIPHGDGREHHLTVRTVPQPDGGAQYIIEPLCKDCEAWFLNDGVIQDDRGRMDIRQRRLYRRWSTAPDLLPYDPEEWEVIEGVTERGAAAAEERRELADLHFRRQQVAALIQGGQPTPTLVANGSQRDADLELVREKAMKDPAFAALARLLQAKY